MEMATLGKTGLRVNRLGAGLVGIGAHPSMDDVSMPGRLLNAALDAGINFLDTAVSTSSDYVRVMDQRLCQWLLCQANSYPVR